MSTKIGRNCFCGKRNLTKNKAARRITMNAKLRANGQLDESRQETRMYTCPRSGNWHLTSQPLRGDLRQRARAGVR